MDQTSVTKLTRDVKASAGTLDISEARRLVDLYYKLQEHRIALRNQERTAAAAELPTELLGHFAGNVEALERQMVAALDTFSNAIPVGAWSRGIVGIGPVLASGLLAHIDIDRAATAGAVWRYAGLDPSVTWNKGQKRPYNATLKKICWRIGDSFVKQSFRDNCLYGHVYVERKQLEVTRNDEGAFADQATKAIETRKKLSPEQRRHYQAGRLPPGRLDLRARRYAVKLFLSHWHHVAYEAHHGEPPPKPYVLTEAGGHAHYIAPPNWSPPNEPPMASAPYGVSEPNPERTALAERADTPQSAVSR